MVGVLLLLSLLQSLKVVVLPGLRIPPVSSIRSRSCVYLACATINSAAGCRFIACARRKREVKHLRRSSGDTTCGTDWFYLKKTYCLLLFRC